MSDRGVTLGMVSPKVLNNPGKCKPWTWQPLILLCLTVHHAVLLSGCLLTIAPDQILTLVHFPVDLGRSLSGSGLVHLPVVSSSYPRHAQPSVGAVFQYCFSVLISSWILKLWMQTCNTHTHPEAKRKHACTQVLMHTRGFPGARASRASGSRQLTECPQCLH